MGKNLKVRYAGEDFEVVDSRVIPGGAVQYCIEDQTGCKVGWINESDAIIKPSSPWIMCSERLPEEDFDDGHQMVFVAINDGEDTWRFDTDYIRDGKWELNSKSNIVYWMPIPPLY